jgi:hypothetical protein
MQAISKSVSRLAPPLAAMILLFSGSAAFAQGAAPQNAPVIVNPSSGSSASQAAASSQEVRRFPLNKFFEDSLTQYEFWLVVVIVFMSLATISCVVRYIARSKNYTPKDIWLPAVVLTIISAILIGATAGYRLEQIGPAFGLFGTMIGYLLRSLSINSDFEDLRPPPPATAAKEASAPAQTPASAGGAKE